jgi:hypothetical protein
MGGEGVEVQVEAVTRKDQNAAGSQDERDRMDEGMGQVQSPRPDLQGGRDLSHGIKGDPHPEILRLVAQSGQQLVQLEMTQVQRVEEMSLLGV